ncbi:MAG: POTRA domain-containing protein, partial [Planctomycetota bacterium]
MAQISHSSARMTAWVHACAVAVLVGLILLPAAPAAGQPLRIIRPEDYQRNTVPKEPDNRAAPVELPERRVDISDDKTVLVKSLLGIRLVPLPKDIEKDPTTTGIEIKNIPLIDNPEFRQVLQPYLGKPVTMRSISLMIRDAVAYYQGKDRPVVDVFVPEQEITKGVVQLLVVEAHVGQIKVTGLKFFSDDLIRSYIALKPGDVIRASKLLADMDYINNNPFRFVRPVLQPGKEFGTTDVIADARDRMPVRFYGGYEDTGSRSTGLEREFVGFNAGNFLGLGHEVGYQYTTNRHVADFGIHSAYWRVPLPNRDTLSFFGNW